MAFKASDGGWMNNLGGSGVDSRRRGGKMHLELDRFHFCLGSRISRRTLTFSTCLIITRAAPFVCSEYSAHVQLYYKLVSYISRTWRCNRRTCTIRNGQM